MSRPFRSTACLLFAAATWLLPASGQAEGQFALPGQSASASLNIRIIIPAVMQVLENSHPERLDSNQPVEQRLVVLSNMRHGFCASLRLSDTTVASWQLQADEVGGVTLQAVADGYRLCASRPGRYILRLQHEFQAVAGASGLRWPVRTDLTAM
jgi:hypothetical protein